MYKSVLIGQVFFARKESLTDETYIYGDVNYS